MSSSDPLASLRTAIEQKIGRWRAAGRHEEERLRDIPRLAGGGVAMHAVYDGCADEVEYDVLALLRAVEQAQQQKDALIATIAAIRTCDDDPSECVADSAPCCQTHGDAYLYATEIAEARRLLSDPPGAHETPAQSKTE